MHLKYLLHLLFALSLGVIGCSTHQVDIARQEPRQLGEKFPSYQSPQESVTSAPEPMQIEEPTDVLTLRQALSLVLMKNPELAVFSWDVRAQEAQTIQAGLFPNPELDVETENFEGSEDLRGFDGAETTIQLSQLIELAGKRSKRKRIALLESDLAGWDYEAVRMDVLVKTTQSFIGVLTSQELLALNEELVNLAEKVLDTVSERVRSGKVPPVEETKARVSMSISHIGLERARRDLETAKRHLAAQWGSTQPSFTRVEGNLDAIAPIPSAEELAQRISQNPDIGRLVVEMEKRRSVLALEDANKIPDLTVSGGYRHFHETEDNAYVMGFSIPLPIFDRNQGRILESRYRVAQAEEEFRNTTIRVKTALVEAYQILSTAYAEAVALKIDVLPGAQEAFDAANEGYRQGKFSYLEVLDAQRTLFEARAQNIEVMGNYHSAVADVERMIGGEPLNGAEEVLEYK